MCKMVLPFLLGFCLLIYVLKPFIRDCVPNPIFPISPVFFIVFLKRVMIFRTTYVALQPK